MTTKLNEKLEFLRRGSEQDLLKEFKKNKAFLKKLKTIKKYLTKFLKKQRNVLSWVKPKKMMRQLLCSTKILS